MTDSISRQAAIDAINRAVTKEAARRSVEELPSAEPERKRGEWIPMQVSSGRDSWKCSVCGRRARGKKENLPFCHCWADMRGEQDE